MTELLSDPTLLSQLKDAAEAGVTSEQMHKQKVSYILGAVSDQSNITKERVEEVLRGMEGIPAN